MDVGDDRGAVRGDGAAARCAGAVQRTGRALLPLVLLAARRHDGHRRARQQRHQLRPLLHHERPVPAGTRRLASPLMASAGPEVHESRDPRVPRPETSSVENSQRTFPANPGPNTHPDLNPNGTSGTFNVVHHL